MQHYICTGECAEESTEAKSCQTTECSKMGEPLTACDCEDGQHYGATQSIDGEGQLTFPTSAR